jgi:3D-(3,5/4)-trihydroxycyclohexane-1,2-dione acylhydrolase (decyclizing)
VPVSAVSELDSTRSAYVDYVDHKTAQRPLLAPPERDERP